ncbi:MAG: hypothetical protein IJS63_06995 [Bacteroidaceae bacterium]|nr:hypothetical protein [Bacteroidaceae bacterium]
MKHKFLLKTMLLLSALIAGSGNVWADEVTFNFPEIASAEGWTSGTAYTSYTITPITVNALGGGNNGKYYSSSNGSWRMYSGGTVSISATEGNTITGVTSNPSCEFTITDGVATFSPSARTDFKTITVTYTTSGSSSAVATTTTIDATGITNTDLKNSTTAGSLSASVTLTSDGTAVPNATVTWSGDNDAVATINASTGAVTLVDEGTVNFTASYAGVENTYAASTSSKYEMTVTDTRYTISDLNFTAAYGSGPGKADDDAEWTVTSDGTESNFDSTSGIHYGTNSAQVQYVQLSTSDIKGTIKKVKVTTRDAQASGSVTVTVGGSSFNYGENTSVTATNTSTEYTFTGSGKGQIIVRVDRGSANTKAIYVKRVKVYYEPSTDPAISASDVDITYDATSGSIDYSLANATGNVSATVTTGSDWLTLGTITEDEVPFTCDANTGAERTATVTLSFSGADDKVVTVTQEGNPNYVPTISEVRAQGTGSVHTVGVVTSVNGKTAYIQDSGAAIAVYNSSDNLSVSVGDEIDVTGTLGTYNGLLQIQSPTISVLSNSNSVTPEVMTIAQVNASTKQGWLVKIEDATVSTISDLNVTIAQSSNTIVVRFNDASDITFAANNVITLTGNIGNYNAVQIANPTDVSVIVNTTPTITPASFSVEATATTGLSGTINVTYENITNVAADIAFYESDGTTAASYDWITVEINSSDNVEYLMDENDGAARSAYFKVWAYDDELNEVYSDLITITQAAYVAPAAPGSWVLATAGLADINANDVFVIVGNNGDTYAMTNDNGTSAPAVAEVTVVSNTLSGTIDSNLQWNLGTDDDGYIFYPNGSTTTWLYCTNANNGVKVGNGDAKHFTIEDGYLTTTETTDQRYIGIYNSQDWRCYTNTTGNIKGQTFAFYKKLAAKLNGNGYATFSATVPVDFSDDSEFSAWVITDISGSTISFAQVTGAVPANTGVLLKGTAGETVYPVAAASGTAPETNLLTAFATTTAVANDGDYYGLKGATFVKVNAGKVPAGKALLPKSAVDGNPVKAFTFVFEEDDATGVETIDNGQLTNDNEIYDLQGRRVQKPSKGLYIVNGKKVLF